MVTINGFLTIVLITAFIPGEIGAECDDQVVTWQWLGITITDTLQTICLATTGIMMFKQ